MGNELYLDGRLVRVGDRMWSLTFGWVHIIDVNVEVRDYPILAKKNLSDFEDILFTQSGEAFRGTGMRCLFWDEFKLPEPPKPKQLFEFFKWAVKNDDGSIYVSDYLTEREAEESFNEDLIGCIKETKLIAESREELDNINGKALKLEKARKQSTVQLRDYNTRRVNEQEKV